MDLRWAVQERLRVRGRRAHVLQRDHEMRRVRPRRAVRRAVLAPLGRRAHFPPLVRARRQAEGHRTRVRRRHLHVQRRGLRAGRSALACADGAGLPGRDAPRSPSPPTRHSDPKQSSVGSAGSFCPRRHSPPPWPPRCIPTPHAVADGRATQPNDRRNATHDHASTRALAGSTYGSHGRHPCSRRRVHTSEGLVEAASLPCRAQRTAVPNAATRGGLHCARRHAHTARRTHAATFRCTPISRGCCPVPTLNAGLRCAPYAPIAAVFFPRASPTPKLCRWASRRALQFRHPVLVWAGRGRRGQPAAALGGARALRPPSVRTARRGTRSGNSSGTKAAGTLRYSRGTLRVYR
jgi:hypothetical protein